MDSNASRLENAMADATLDDWVDVKGEPRGCSQKPIPPKLEDEGAESSFYTSTADAALVQLNKDASPIFMVDVPQDVLWSEWLDNLDTSQRQVFNCMACRLFIKRYGG